MKFEELPDWRFKVLETSMNVYKATCVDSVGRTVERQGLDSETLLDEAKQDALEITGARLQKPSI
ncbi:hypothetical protein [Pararhizobium sp. A13]|uniref:hypothetical protein n=1 Tax=Pararhizobium sp. A13 TaxID=3133975 RepID=UPI00324F73B8